jgi:hypothetical protein
MTPMEYEHVIAASEQSQVHTLATQPQDRPCFLCNMKYCTIKPGTYLNVYKSMIPTMNEIFAELTREIYMYKQHNLLY